MKTQKSVIVYEDSVFDPLKFVEEYVPDFSLSETSTGFCDLSDILCRLKRWRSECPEIAPILVLRRNNDPKVVDLLSSYGCRFIGSSPREIDDLLRGNIRRENIIMGNNVLTREDCSFAKASGINLLQIGRIASLENIQAKHSDARVILNVSLNQGFNGFISQNQFIFGNSPNDFKECLLLAQQKKINVVGLSMSKAPTDLMKLGEILSIANNFIGLAESLGFQMKYVSLPEVIQDLSIDSMSNSLRIIRSFRETFHEERQIQFFCENYDFLTTASLTIFTTVQSVRRMKIANSDEEKVQYFIDDGKFNSFRKVPQSIAHSKISFVRRYSTESSETDKLMFRSEIFGPSCDGDDIVAKTVMMPQLENGDLICFTNVGTDTTSMRTSFNGFLNCDIHHFVNFKDRDVLENNGDGQVSFAN